MNHDFQEKVITLGDMLFAVLYQWKKWLLAAVILGLAIGGFKGVSAWRTATDETVHAEQEQDYQSALVSYENTKNLLEHTIEQSGQGRKNQEEYLKNSVLMKLDYRNVYTTTVSLYISTDYVFNGQGETPWQPDCTDYAPLNVYGRTKLDGELAVRALVDKFFIVRIAWVFGINGKNFIKTMLRLGETHDTLRVVDDQIGTPTYTLDLARLLVDMIETDKYGYYHVTNEGGYISWYDFTKEIFRQAVELGHTEYSEDRLTVLPVTTAEYGLSKAKRPFNSRLDKSKLVKNGFTPLPTWQDALRRYLKEFGM